MPQPQILFISSNRLGDAILSTGVLAQLIEDYPEGRFSIVCGPLSAALFRAVPRLDKLIVVSKQSFARHWLDVFAKVSPTHWDVLVDMRNVGIVRFVRAKKRYRWRRADRPMHKVEENALVLGKPARSPEIWLDAVALAAADKYLPQKGPIIFLGASAANPKKIWPTSRFAELACRLIAPSGPFPDAKVALLGTPPEQQHIDEVKAALPANTAIDLVGQLDVAEVAACLKRAAMFIGNDSGLTHMAAATGIPTLGLFGSGFPALYRPWGAACAYLEKRLTEEKQREIEARPLETQGEMMEAITVDDAEAAVLALLSSSKRATNS